MDTNIIKGFDRTAVILHFVLHKLFKSTKSSLLLKYQLLLPETKGEVVQLCFMHKEKRHATMNVSSQDIKVGQN